MAFCTNCGTKIENNMKFCPNCGASLDEDAPVSAPSPVSEAEPHTVSKAASAAAEKIKAVGSAAVEKGIPVIKAAGTAAVEKGIPVIKAAGTAAVEKGIPAIKAAGSAAVEKGIPAIKAAGSAAAEKGAPVIKAAGDTAKEKGLPMLKRHYKVIGIGALALVVLLVLTRFVGGGKQDDFLEDIQGSWEIETLVGGNQDAGVWRTRSITITKNIIHLGNNPHFGPVECPMSETEYKDGALYFSASWYDSFPGGGLESGVYSHDARLTYSKKDDLLTLEIKLPGEWYPLGEYRRG